jgi:hypothetical protein
VKTLIHEVSSITEYMTMKIRPSSPSQGSRISNASPMSTACFACCSAVTYVACLPLQRPPIEFWFRSGRAGSGAHRNLPWGFCSRHVGAAARSVCDGLRLKSFVRLWLLWVPLGSSADSFSGTTFLMCAVVSPFVDLSAHAPFFCSCCCWISV